MGASFHLPLSSLQSGPYGIIPSPIVHATLLLVLVGMFVINDGLRLASFINMPLHFKFFLYGLALVVVVGCLSVAKAIEQTNRLDKLGSSTPGPPASSLNE